VFYCPVQRDIVLIIHEAAICVSHDKADGKPRPLWLGCLTAWVSWQWIYEA